MSIRGGTIQSTPGYSARSRNLKGFLRRIHRWLYRDIECIPGGLFHLLRMMAIMAPRKDPDPNPYEAKSISAGTGILTLSLPPCKPP